MIKTIFVDKTEQLNNVCGDTLYLTSSQEIIDYCKRRNIPVAAVEGEGESNLSCDYILQDLEEVDDLVFEQIYQRCKGIPWDISDTKRTHIREFGINDLDELFALYNKPGVTEFMEPLYSYDEELAYEKNYIDYIYKLYGFGMWLVFDKKSNELIGRAGIEVRETCTKANQAELGFCISPDRWGQGLAYEVCSEIIRLAKEEYGLESLIARSHPGNFKSHGLLKKLDFEQRGLCSDGDYFFYKNL